MNFMFFGCTSLKGLYLPNFKADKLIDASSMFAECSSLIKLDLSNFNTNRVKKSSNMFKGCLLLTEKIDIPCD